MAYGFMSWNADGSVGFDSTLAVGGVPIGLHSIASGSGTVTYTWPDLAGGTVVVLPVVWGDYVDYVVDYALGYPRVVYTKRATSASVNLVMAVGTPTPTGYGLQVSNPGGELVLSTSGYGLNYVGKASLQSTTVASGTPTTVGGRTNGQVVHRITGCPSYPIPFHTLPSGSKVGLLDITSLGGGTYDLTYHVENGSYDAFGFGTIANNGMEVFVYSRLASGPGGYGFALFDSAGAIAYDLTNRPLLAVQRMAYANKASSAVTIASLTKPAFFGNINAYLKQELINGAGPQYNRTTDRYGLQLSGTSLSIQSLRRFYSRALPQLDDDAADVASNVFLIEASSLP